MRMPHIAVEGFSHPLFHITSPLKGEFCQYVVTGSCLVDDGTLVGKNPESLAVYKNCSKNDPVVDPVSFATIDALVGLLKETSPRGEPDKKVNFYEVQSVSVGFRPDKGTTLATLVCKVYSY